MTPVFDGHSVTADGGGGGGGGGGAGGPGRYSSFELIVHWSFESAQLNDKLVQQTAPWLNNRD